MVRKFLQGLNILFSLLVIISTFCSCTNEINMLDGNNNKQINFSISVPEWQNTDSLSSFKTSRATPITDASLSTSNTFNLIADLYDGTGGYTTLIDKEAVSSTNNIWQTTPSHYYWSGIVNKTVNFYAYYPTSISNNISHTAGSAPTLSYTVPDDASNQFDIMTATANNVSGNTNSSTPLTFNHIFAAVKFRSGSLGLPSGNNTIIKIKGIQYKGIYTFNNGWVNSADRKDFYQNVNLSTFGVSTDITNDGTTFMMLPQTLSNVTIEVTYNNGLVLSKTINGKWEANNVYTYNLSKTIVFNYDYTGASQTFTAPYTGIYKLEVWGAQGGKSTDYPGSNIGNGGYAYGNIYLNSSANLYVCVGGTGNSTLGGYNGGYPALPNGGAGGGATHIAATNRDVLSNYNNFQSEVLIVAGGGGGVDNSSNSGSGGGLIGGNGTAANGGTQTNGGSGGINGSFGKGGITQSNGDYGAAGGGGWYGGGGTSACGGGAGGGSGHLGPTLITGTTGMQNGVRSGDGYARITFVSAN